MELNSSQQKAVLKREGPCLVLAGPGSGKTAVLTMRIMELIKSGIPAEEILVITFTKAAAIEMKERFDRLSDDVHPVTFGTFHSLFWGILQRELGLKSSDIITGRIRNNILKEAMKKASLQEDDATLLNSFVTELSALNNSGLNIDEYKTKLVDRDDLRAFFKAYEELKAKYKVVDFDDMLNKAYRLFLSKPDVLHKWQKRFSYFLVDEMQDMNNIQFELIQMISSRTRNLFCVGDDDQSIYGFRGANPKLMQTFLKVYPEAETILLDYNYRNPANIVASSGKLISKNKNRFGKEIKSTKEAGRLEVIECRDEHDEAALIVKEINKLRAEGRPLDEIAVLYRNHSDARYLVDALINAEIPFYLKEQMPNIYTHFIIADIEAYFQIAMGNSTKSRLLSILNRPNRYLHRRSVEAGGDIDGMLKFYSDNWGCYNAVLSLQADLRLIRRMSPAAAVNYINNAMGYSDFLKAEAISQDKSYSEYKEIIDFLIQIFKDCRTIRQAIDKLNTLRLKIDFENKSKQWDRSGKVGLYTLHASKGLEFENVFIISINEGIIPTNKADTTEAMESERRLFYVGITRTKKNLYLSYTNKKNRDKSRFIDELDYSSSRSSL